MRRGAALALSIALPLAAQQTNALQSRLQQAIADLGAPDRAAAAALALHNLGPATVPALRKLLAPSQRGSELELRLVNALFVLGDLGKPAAAAMPELADVLEVENGALLQQGLWAAQRLLSWMNEDQRARLSTS